VNTATAARLSSSTDNRPPAAPRRHGRSRLLLTGAVLAVLGALAGVVVVGQVGQREPAVAVARHVPFGQQIVDQDLRRVLLPPDTELAIVEWSRLDEIVGRIAATDLLPGQVVTPDAVTTERLPGPGQAVVGVAVERGRVPVTPLAARDQVLVIDAGETSGSGVGAMVLRTGEIDLNGQRTVDLLIAATDAPRVARLAEAGRAVLVLVAGR
jgi:hypothetical protein